MRYRVIGVWVSTKRDGVVFVVSESPENAGKEAVRQGLLPRLIAPAEPLPRAPVAQPREPAHAGAREDHEGEACRSRV